MRFLTGIYLLVFGFVWVWMLDDKGAWNSVFPSLELAQAFGLLSFALGVFSISPRLWAWREAEEGTLMANLNQLLRGSWYGVGGVMALMGLGMLGLGMVMFKTIGAAAAFLAVLTGLVYAIGGAALVRAPMLHQSARQALAHRADPTNLVLRVARAAQGRVTPTEIAAETHLDVRQAAKLLATLRAEGFCEERVSEHGTSFFYFPEFASPGAKRDLFEDGPMTLDLHDHERERAHDRAGVAFDHEGAAGQAHEDRARAQAQRASRR